MSNTNDGGPAFPKSDRANRIGGRVEEMQPGMSLRAYVAVKITAAFASNPDLWQEMMVDRGRGEPNEYVVKEACKLADALIAELERSK